MSDLQHDLERFSEEQRGELLKEFSRAWLQLRLPKNAVERLQDAAQQLPQDVAVHRLLFEAALESRDDSTAQYAIARMQDIDGKLGIDAGCSLASWPSPPAHREGPQTGADVDSVSGFCQLGGGLSEPAAAGAGTDHEFD